MVTTMREIRMVASRMIGTLPSSVAELISAPRRNKEGEDAGKDEAGPALIAGEAVEARNFFEIRRDGHGSGDDVKEDVPLGAEEHKRNGANAEPSANLYKSQENQRVICR